MDPKEQNLILKLIEKSKESFLLAIEIYNKPTIKYRVESFSFFICNAWELMLKAHLSSTVGISSIYYPDNPDRTISLSECVRKVFTNNKDPLRLNLEKIIELRDTSTHFVMEEYEMVYIPLFQSCVLNFNEKMLQFHKFDITSIIPQNFLTLSISMEDLEESNIIAKYPDQIAKKILNIKSNIEHLSINNNANFAININHYHYITKDEKQATSKIKVDNSASGTVKIIKELKDPNNTHKYTTKACVEIIKNMLLRKNVSLQYNGNHTEFSIFHFLNFCNHFGLKGNENFCYVHKNLSTPQYTYSQQTIDFIVTELKKDPYGILDNIKK